MAELWLISVVYLCIAVQIYLTLRYEHNLPVGKSLRRGLIWIYYVLAGKPYITKDDKPDDNGK